jgi:hypothetical protein
VLFSFTVVQLSCSWPNCLLFKYCGLYPIALRVAPFRTQLMRCHLCTSLSTYARPRAPLRTSLSTYARPRAPYCTQEHISPLWAPNHLNTYHRSLRPCTPLSKPVTSPWATLHPPFWTHSEHSMTRAPSHRPVRSPQGFPTLEAASNVPPPNPSPLAEPRTHRSPHSHLQESNPKNSPKHTKE